MYSIHRAKKPVDDSLWPTSIRVLCVAIRLDARSCDHRQLISTACRVPMKTR